MATERPRILVVGSANVDMIMGLPRLPERCETVTGGKFLRTFGGKGANQAVAAQRAGSAVTFVGCFGRDEHGASIQQALSQDNIDLRWCTVTDAAPTGAALVLFDDKGENYLAVAPGSNHELKPRLVEPALSRIGDYDAVLLQMEIPFETNLAVAERARNAGVRVLFNFAPALNVDLEPFGAAGTHLIANELEAAVLVGRKLTERQEAEAAAVELQRRFPAVTITLGAEGSVHCDGDGVVFTPVRKTQAVDTTAAGDTFCGALATALCLRNTTAAALRYATVAASLCVERAGAQASIPAQKEILDALASPSQ